MTARRAAGFAVALLLLVRSVVAADIPLPMYERLQLPNGAVLVLSEKHGLPLIGLEAVVRGGAVTDPAGLNGQADLLARLLRQGAGDRDAAAFAQAVDAVGGKLSVAAGLEAIRITADFMSRDGELMIDLVADMLQRPTLDEAAMTALRDRAIERIRLAKDRDPGSLLPDYGKAWLFGTHPYGNPIGGSEATLAAITHESLLQQYNDELGGDRLIISVVGDFKLERMKARLTAAFGAWRPAQQALPTLNVPDRQSGRRVILIDKPAATRTDFWIGNIGVAVDYPERAALDLVNTVFGGRETSMLNNALRNETGLTHDARSLLLRRSVSGAVVISSSTGTGTTIEALELALDTLRELRTSGIDEDALRAAKNTILGQFPPRLETAPQLAAQFAMLEQFGLDTAYVEGYAAGLEAAAVNDAAIRAVIADVYPSPDDVSLILIGDAASIREAVARFGPVTETSIDLPRFRQ